MLELTTKYAIKALLQLSKLKSDQFIQVKELSKRASIPGPYLSKLIKILAAGKLVDTRRGAMGGVRLPVSKKTITFLEVCRVLEDPIIDQECFLSSSSCNAKTPCLMHHNWLELRKHIFEFLDTKKI